jgi:hypothetical protein
MRDGCQLRSRLRNRKERRKGTRSLKRNASMCCLGCRSSASTYTVHGERFGVITAQSALAWLTSMRYPKHRLARWILAFQSFDFDVENASGHGSIMVIPCDRIIAPRQPQMAHAIGCRSRELSLKNLVFGTVLRAVFSASAMGFCVICNMGLSHELRVFSSQLQLGFSPAVWYSFK